MGRAQAIVSEKDGAIIKRKEDVKELLEPMRCGCLLRDSYPIRLASWQSRVC